MMGRQGRCAGARGLARRAGELDDDYQRARQGLVHHHGLSGGGILTLTGGDRSR